MKKGLTELVFILDRSGSMGGLEEDTIGGFNGMINKQKKEEGSAVVTTVLFDDKYELLHDRIDIQGILPMNDRQYYVRGCTALLDAIGMTIEKMINVHKHTAKEQRAEKVIFTIITDGMENSSRKYNKSMVKELIQAQKARGWEFIFLGANMDAVEEAASFGIDSDRAVTYQNDREGVELNYEVISEAVSAMRCCSVPIGRSWKSRIEEDQAKRGKTGR